MKSIRTIVFAVAFVLATAGIAVGRPLPHQPRQGQAAALTARHGVEQKHDDARDDDKELRDDEGFEKGDEKGDRADSKRAPDSLTGLANAIFHVRANLADHPNQGLQNALDHLMANQKRHGGEASGHGDGHKKDKSNGNGHSHGNGSQHHG
jgi:hypothetical protein